MQKKLIRNFVTDSLKQGEWEEITDRKELNELFALKIREELSEIQQSNHNDLSEFGDLIAVAYSFAYVNGFDYIKIQNEIQRKSGEKGSFSKHLALNNLNPGNPSNTIYFELSKEVKPNPSERKSLDDVKNIVAQEQGFGNWDQLLDVDGHDYSDEVAELYAAQFKLTTTEVKLICPNCSTDRMNSFHINDYHCEKCDTHFELNPIAKSSPSEGKSLEEFASHLWEWHSQLFPDLTYDLERDAACLAGENIMTHETFLEVIRLYADRSNYETWERACKHLLADISATFRLNQIDDNISDDQKKLFEAMASMIEVYPYDNYQPI